MTEARRALKAQSWISGAPVRDARDAARAKRALPLDQMRGLPNAKDSGAPGVYFLWWGPSLEYVGKAAHVGDRVRRHFLKKQFTHATFLEVGVPRNRAAEVMYCLAYMPRQNLTRCG